MTSAEGLNIQHALRLQYTLALLKHKPADACCWRNFHQVGCEAFIHSPDAFQRQGLLDDIKHATVLQWYTTHSLRLQQQCAQC